MKQGVVDYLIKPVRPEKLTEIVSKHVKGQPSDRPLENLVAVSRIERETRGL